MKTLIQTTAVLVIIASIVIGLSIIVHAERTKPNRYTFYFSPNTTTRTARVFRGDAVTGKATLEFYADGKLERMEYFER